MTCDNDCLPRQEVGDIHADRRTEDRAYCHMALDSRVVCLDDGIKRGAEGRHV